MRKLTTPARLGAGLAASLGAAALAAGCGGSSSDGTSATTATSASSGAAHAARALDEARRVPRFTLRAPAFDAAAVRGKTIFSIPAGSGIAAIARLDAAAARVARQHGARWIEYRNQGTPTEWGAGVHQAISQQADLIFLSAVPPEAIAPALQKAKQAGIPVLLGQSTPYDRLAPAIKPLITNTVNQQYERIAALMADWAVEATDGKADVLVLDAPEASSSAPMIAAFTAELRRTCSGCAMKVVHVPAAQWATQVAGTVSSAIRANPKLNAIVALYDPMAAFAAQGVQQAGANGKVGIASFGGTPAVLKMIQDGSSVKMNVGAGETWTAYGIFDQAARILTGAPQVPGGDEQINVRVFDASNVAQAGTPPDADRGYGDAYVRGYEALWSAK